MCFLLKRKVLGFLICRITVQKFYPLEVLNKIALHFNLVMKAIYLVRKGPPEKAFEFRDVEIPAYSDKEVLIKVEGFGLNFADLVAREGMYRMRPPMPFIPGYDVVGSIEACGTNVYDLKKGDRVTALTRLALCRIML